MCPQYTPRAPRRPKVERICETCGGRFLAFASQVDHGYGRYCGRDCMAVAFRGLPQAVTCLQCGTSFPCKPSIARRDGTRFCSTECRSRFHSGPQHPHWQGGRSHTQGYVTLRQPDGRKVREHRRVMAEHLGRPLARTELVHHRDGNRANNAIENLEVMTRGGHTRHHHAGVSKRPPGQWAIRHVACVGCGTIERPHKALGLCGRCYERHQHPPKAPSVRASPPDR